MNFIIIFCNMLQSGIITKITKFISDIPSITKLLLFDILGLIISLCIIYYVSDKQKVIHSSRTKRMGGIYTEIWAKNPDLRFYQVLSVGFLWDSNPGRISLIQVFYVFNLLFIIGWTMGTAKLEFFSINYFLIRILIQFNATAGTNLNIRFNSSINNTWES